MWKKNCLHAVIYDDKYSGTSFIVIVTSFLPRSLFAVIMEYSNFSSPLPPTTSPFSDVYYYIEVILLAIFFFLGAIGNSIVVVVYKPTRVQCVHVWFVFVLAVVDLISSSFCK